MPGPPTPGSHSYCKINILAGPLPLNYSTWAYLHSSWRSEPARTIIKDALFPFFLVQKDVDESANACVSQRMKHHDDDDDDDDNGDDK